MRDMLIPQNEFFEWLSEEPQVHQSLREGYRSAISDMGDDLLADPRSCKNNHLVNPEFSIQPRYFMGFTQQGQQLTLSCLYVFPQYRVAGLAKHLLDEAKKMVSNEMFIQVAVEEQKLTQLDGFYKKQGFISTDDIIQTYSGLAYRDYFWSRRPIRLSRNGNSIAVKFP